MQLREAYTLVANTIQAQYGESEARSIARLLIESIAGLEGIAWFINQGIELSEPQIVAVHESLLQLQVSVPIQYVTGKAWFYGLQLKVSPSVLIPRQETEQLVRMALPYCKAGTQVVDLCTGSGCIAIAIKKNAPNSIVSAVDISQEALEIAQYNAKTLQAEIQFWQEDVLLGPSSDSDKLWDVILCNPPYIPLKELDALAEHVRQYEPHLALFGAEHNPLNFYQALLQHYIPKLVIHGKMFVELHAALAMETAQVFQSESLDVQLVLDIHDKPRFLEITKIV